MIKKETETREMNQKTEKGGGEREKGNEKTRKFKTILKE